MNDKQKDTGLTTKGNRPQTKKRKFVSKKKTNNDRQSIVFGEEIKKYD